MHKWKCIAYNLSAHNYQFGETTPPGYSEPLQTLNVELLLIAPFGA